MDTDLLTFRQGREHGPHVPPSGGDYAFGRFTLHPARKLLACAGAPVVLGGRAFDLLVTLVARAGEVVGHHALLAAVWPHAVVEENGLRVHMSALRKALGETPDDQYIVTVPGRGYRFVKPVRALAPVPCDPFGPTSGQAGMAPAPAPAPRWRLAMRLLGRDDAAAELERLLARSQVVTLTGPGGIGKTALALRHAATHGVHGAHYGDGCHLVDFAALDDPALALAALCAALGIAHEPNDPLAAIGAALGPLHALLVLDNCEHVLAQAGAIAAAIAAVAPWVRVLATSRVPLGLEGEAVYRLAPLGLPAPDATPDCAAARAHPAIALFVERAQANASRFALEPDNLAAVLQLCRQLDGLPLAIELAAARVEALGVEGLVARLDDMFLLLTCSRRLASPRHAALEAMLDCSHCLLDEAERTVLRRLAVFHGAFSLESAVRVCAFGGLAPADVLRAVPALAVKSLLCSEPGPGPARYRSLNTTRRYARLRLAASGEAHEAARRHAVHLRALFAQPAGEASDDGLGAELLAALDWAFGEGGEARLGLALCAEAPLSMIALGMLDGLRRRIETALVIAGEGHADPALEVRLLAAWTLASTPVALPPGQRAAMQARLLRHAEKMDHAPAPATRAHLASALCVGAFMAGDYARMVAASAAMARQAGQQGAGPDAQAARLLASRWSALGLHFQGRHREARVRALQTLESFMPPDAARLQGPVPQRVSMGMVLARSEWIEGAADVALARACQVVAMAESGHPYALGLALGMALAPVALWRGDEALALQALERLDAHARRHALGFWSAWAAQLRMALGASSQTVQTLPMEMALDPMAIEMLATVRPGLLSPAMLDAAGRGQETWCDPELLRVRAELGEVGAEAGVEAKLAQAIVLAQAQGALAWELRASTSLARRWERSGRVHAALALLDGVLARFHQGFDTADLRAATGLRARLADIQDEESRLID